MTMTWCRIPLATLAMAAAFACSESSSPTEPTPGTWPVRISLQEHESLAVPRTDLTVTLEEVQLLATSCVPNVPCPAFLAGVTIGVRAAGDAVTRTTFYAYDGASPLYLRAVHHGYVVRFVNLTPAISFTPPAEPYRVDLEIGPDGAAPR
jgi:hypothetical protein